MNEDLLRPFSPDEVKQALFQMHPSKAPGPDESQRAFVPGRMITDNVIIAFEAIHHLKNLRGGKNAQLAAKLDMSKAYDRVEWDYLRAVMEKLGFHARWVDLIMVCVTSVSYSIMINGDPKGYIKPGQGIRQGDPLSPYLFLICAEGLSALMRKAERDRMIRGVSICRGGPRISHLFFADDSIIFCRAKLLECTALQEILTLYGRASGQLVNGDKTALFFSHNTPSSLRVDISGFFGTTLTTNFEKYLGLPPIIGRAKKRAFNEIKDRIWKRLQGWKEKLLSQAGREVLIKAVIQAIPTYAMSCFQFPAGLCQEISSMAYRFWWGQRNGGRKIHWMNKKKLYRTKQDGGMGFRDLHLFNSALLARLGWRLMHNPSSLVYRVLKAKYFPHTSFLDATVPDTASYIWCSICKSIEVLNLGLRWRVGTGEHIRIWKDPWVPSSCSYRVISPVSVLDEYATVDHLIHRDTMTWKVDLLNEIFCPRDVELILKIPLSWRRPSDVLIWAGTKRGTFSVPPKVKLFVWKACQNIIPTQTKLFEKGIAHSYSCLWCEDEPETNDHVLWGCEFAQKVWNLCPVPIGAYLSALKSFTDVIGSFTSDLHTPVLEIAFTTVWALWKARNESVWEAKTLVADAIVHEAVSLASEFLDTQSKTGVPMIGLVGPSRWQRPPSGVFKLNMACHSISKSCRYGLGVLIRDSEGAVMAVLEDSLLSNNELLQLHARAVLVAIKFAYDVGLRCLVVELDNQELCSLIQAGSPCFDPIGVIVDDICSSIPLFSFLCFGFSKKSCNKAANALATEAASSLITQVWLDDHPTCITPFIQDDIL
uniref:Reverse transcriptase domain-containing protein n=1 Tax=Fagus sylvatica TaxID=28930 RepID=A0A2N9FNB8_FAGSY